MQDMHFLFKTGQHLNIARLVKIDVLKVSCKIVCQIICLDIEFGPIILAVEFKVCSIVGVSDKVYLLFFKLQ